MVATSSTQPEGLAQQQEEPQLQAAEGAPPAKQQQQQQQQEQQQQDPEARYRYDDKLLIRKGKGKGEVVPPTKPNVEEKRLVITKLLEEISRRNERIRAIKQQQEVARTSSRASVQASTNPALQRLQALKQQFNTLLRHKQHIAGEHRAVCQERDVLREQLRQMKERLPKRTAKDGGEAELLELEFELQTSSMSPAEEKGKQARLRELAAARPMQRDVQAAEERFTERTATREALSKQVQALNTELNGINACLESEKATVEAARASGNNQAEQSSLNAEKQECWECIQVLRAKINEIDKEFSAKYQEWIKLDKNYNAYVRSVERQKYLERQAKRAEKAQREAEEAEMAAARANGSAAGASSSAADPSAGPDSEALPPYAGELLKLDQLLTCLRKLLPAEDKGGVQHGEKKTVEVPQGMKPMKKKDDEEEFMSVPKKKPQGKKGAPAAEAPAPAPKSTEPAKKKLFHQLETLQTFMQYGIEVPQWSTEVANTIQKVEAKKQEFVTKGQQEKEAKANGTFRAPAKEGKSAPAAAASTSEGSKAKEGGEAEPSSANGGGSEERQQQQQQQGEQQQQEQGEQQQQPEEPPAANGNHAEEANGDVSRPSEQPSEKKASRKGDRVDVTLHVDSASERVAVQLAA